MITVFQSHPNAEKRRASAITLIKAILPLDIYEPHRRKFLSNCLWKLTEADGCSKYELRYRSRASLDAKKQDLRHEHVIPRKKMVADLMDRPDLVDDIVKGAVGCVVTREEHERLAKVR